TTNSKPSPHQGDNLEDADAAPRKRRRMDNGDGEDISRSVSAEPTREPNTPEPALSGIKQTLENNTSQQATPSRLSINVKDQNPSETSVRKFPIRKDTLELFESPNPHGTSKNHSDLSAESYAMSTLSSPATLDVDSPTKEASEPVLVVEEDELVATLWAQFPLMASNPTLGAQAFADFFQNATLQLCDLQQLTSWLNTQNEALQDRRLAWQAMYSDKQPFWEMLAKALRNLVLRQMPFADDVGNHEALQGVQDFLFAYTRLCVRFMALDALTLNNLAEDASIMPSLFSTHPANSLRVFFTGHKDKVIMPDVMARHYRADPDRISLGVVACFLEPTVDGMGHLNKLVRAVTAHISKGVKLERDTSTLLHFAEHVSHYVHMFGSQHVEDFSRSFQCVDYPAKAQDLILALHEQLPQLTISLGKSQHDVLKTDLVYCPATMIGNACSLSATVAESLLSDYVGYKVSAEDRKATANFVVQVWKLRVLKHYVSRGNMTLRKLGVTTMEALLTTMFKTAGDAEDPFLQMNAQILLNEEIAESILGAGSHPRIIEQSSNIVGFIAITKNFSVGLTDSICRNLLPEEDPHRASATLGLLTRIVEYMRTKEVLYFFKKMQNLSLDHLHGDEMELFQGTLYRHVELNTQTWLEDELKFEPLRFTCGLIRRAVGRAE
ncbi:hypothetical protein LTS18_007677, partial [Coniosporium uncinatum]